MISKGKKKPRREDLVELEFLEALRRRRPDDHRIVRALGDLCTRVGRIEEGLKLDLALVKLCPRESEAWYNLGCSHALLGDKEAAFDALARAVDLGYGDPQWMVMDGDLESLRADPRFNRLLHRIAFPVAGRAQEERRGSL